MEATATILLAEEDPATRAFLGDNLAADGYALTVAADHAEAVAALSARRPQLIVVDVSGATLSLIDAVRQGQAHVDQDTPILVLSGDADALQRVRVLERGADDIVTKPFAYPELRARIAALLRRARARSRPRVLRVGALSIELGAHEARVAGSRLKLTGKEYALLVTMAAEPARVFTKAELLRDVWDYQASAQTRTVESHAARLRCKLAEAGATGMVRNLWGVGYQLCPSEALR
jgi:DNA-binding response OmpR family regulator